MSTGLLILIATSTAATVIIVALVVTRLARTVVENASELVPDITRVPAVFARRTSSTPRPAPPVPRERPRPAIPGGQILPPGDKPAAAKPAAAPAGAPLLLPAGDNRDVPAGRSDDVKFREPKPESTERAGEIAGAPPVSARSVEGDGPAYRQVGEEVTAVLTAAEHAAVQIREAAARDAEATRLDADEKAAAVLAEAQARRAEADKYSQDTRAAADAYAEETRRNTEELAARSVSEAEERARQIRTEAEEAARNLQAAAVRRREELAKGAEAMEARIESMRTVFQGVAAELEELLPADRRTTEKPEPRTDERLDEALKPTSSQGAG